MAIPLRDEILALRQLLGYSPTTFLLIPEMDPRLDNSSMWDILLVGIDIDTIEEYEEIIPDQKFHIGLSILDTRDLQRLASIPPELPGTHTDYDIIQSYQFTIGTGKYCKRAARRFLFGESEDLGGPDGVAPRFTALVPSDRAVVFVLHGGAADLKMLSNFGIDREPIYTIDTIKAAQTPLRLTYRYSMITLLDVLGIPYKYLHVAGNDAHFCLQTLLMLAVIDGEQCEEQNSLTPSANTAGLFRVLSAIAQAPRPLSKRELEVPLDEVQQAEAAAQKRQAITEKRRRKRAARSERRRLEREGRTHHEDEGEEEDKNDSGDGHDSNTESGSLPHVDDELQYRFARIGL